LSFFLFGGIVTINGTLGSVLSTQTFTYGKDGWGDVLAKINTTSVLSDAVGNIQSDGTAYYTWKNGRQLATLIKSGTTWTFTYDANGLRTERTNGSTTYRYTYDGSTLTQMTVGSNALIFTYGINGQPMSVKYNGADYYYITNAQGDVVGILNGSGTEVVTYAYDAWGNLISTGGSMAYTLGDLNPLRYRGYVYDQETGLYYLQSRYYNPAICRFISADSIGFLGADGTPVSYNLFAYCENNPIMYKLNTTALTGFTMADWENGGFQIPIWISSLISGSDFSASIAPVLQTIYQYVRYPGIKDLNRLYGLDFVPGKLNTACSIIGYGLLAVNIGLSALSNFTNDNLTIKQQWIGFSVDTVYTVGTFGAGYGVGALVSLIPVVGVFVAPFAAAGVAMFIDWTNEQGGWLNGIKQWLNDL